MRFCTLAALLASTIVVAGCQGDGGAVSVRWRIVDLSTGSSYDPGSTVSANHGYCCVNRQGNECSGDNIWIVQTVGIVLRDAGTGAFVQRVSPFPCNARERTTGFSLAPGSFAVGLEATVVDGTGAPAPVTLPPPEVRTILRGDVVNLEVIEIGVDPLVHPLPRSPAAVTF